MSETCGLFFSEIDEKQGWLLKRKAPRPGKSYE